MVTKKITLATKSKLYFFLSLTLITVAILSVVVYFGADAYFDSRPEVAEASEEVRVLFKDPQHIYLADGITEEKISHVKAFTGQLKGRKAHALHEAALIAQNKYIAIKETSELFSLPDSQPIFSMPLDNLVLSQSTTLDSVKQVNSKIQLLRKDRLSEQLKLYSERANLILTNLEDTKKLVEEFYFPTDFTNGFNDLLTKVDELEAIVAPVRIQPQYSELKPIIQAKFDLLKQEIVKLADADKVSPEDKELLLSKPIIAGVLNGTSLNPLKLASLTFDDGPNEEYTGQVLDILNQYHIKGTFFVMGAYVDQHPKMAKRIVDEGHIIGNHSYSHPNFDKETDETIKKQINWTQESIKDVTGVAPTLYRLPFGAGGLRAVKLLEPLTSIIWNVDSEDWATQDAQKIYEKVMGSLSNNSLILMHDTHQATPDALKKIIPAMLEQGYIFVSPDKVGFDLRYYDNKAQ